MVERICGRMNIKRINPMLKFLVLGICLYAVIGAGIILLFTHRVLWHLSGFAIGILLALIMVINMNATIQESVYRGEQGSLKYTRIMYAVRVIIMVVTFVVMIIFKIGNPITALFGLFSLKFSAYLKLITIKFKSKGR